MKALTLLAKSVTLKCDGEVPFRVVLCAKATEQGIYEFVVWHETFAEVGPAHHTGFNQGSYFQVRGNYKEALANAWNVFAQRSAVRERYIGIGELIIPLELDM